MTPFLALLALAAVYSPAMAATDTSNAATHEQVQLSLSGTIQGPTESIDINGTLNVNVVTYPPGPVTPNPMSSARIVATLVNTTGTGETTGGTYRFTGTDTSFNTYPPNPGGGHVLTFTPTFTIFPPNPFFPRPDVPPGPIKILQVSVPIAADGTIGEITATLLTPTT